MKKCPYCAEEIQDEAIKCRFCGSMLGKRPEEKWYFKPATLIIAFLCIGPFMLPLVWFNPRFNRKAKTILTIVILIITYLLASALSSSINSISNYYRIIYQ